MILLEEAWSELFLLSAIQWALPMDKCPLLSRPDRPSSEQPKASLPTVDLHCLGDVFDRFKVLAVDPTEFACLKAIVLFKPGEIRSVWVCWGCMHAWIITHIYVFVSLRNAKDVCLTL